MVFFVFFLFSFFFCFVFCLFDLFVCLFVVVVVVFLFLFFFAGGVGEGYDSPWDVTTSGFLLDNPSSDMMSKPSFLFSIQQK